jgi:rhomboid protease GluP
VRYIVNGDQIPSLTIADLNLPLEIADGFWSPNTHNQRLSTPSDTLLMSYCPQLIGPCWTPVRRRDFLRLLRTFTIWLIAAQIVLFAISLSKSRIPLATLEIDLPVLVAYGGLTAKSLKRSHQYWRLFTNVFVSGSISQLFVNVALEFIFVLSREASWNTLRLLSIFFCSAICGAIIALVFDPDGFVIGASPGIFGVYGGFIALYGITFESLQWKHRIAVLFMLFLNVILLIFATSLKHSANAGHAGGFGFGLAMGLLMFAGRSETEKSKSCARTTGGVAASCLVLFPVLYFAIFLDVG